MTREQEQALIKRLHKDAITWVIDNSLGPFDAVKELANFQEASVLNGVKTDVFLVADETRSLDGLMLDDIKRAGRAGVRYQDVVITMVGDYGTVDNLDVEGGFGYMIQDKGYDRDLGRVCELRVKFRTGSGREMEVDIVFARIEKMEFVSRFLMSNGRRKNVRMSSLFMRHHWHGFNPQMFVGSWPATIAASLGATRLVSDVGSIDTHFALRGYSEADDAYARIVEKFPWFARLPQIEIIHRLTLDDELSLYELVSSIERHNGQDIRVGDLARRVFAAYFQSSNCLSDEIARLQDGVYCHETFALNSTMPALVPVSAIENAPDGKKVGERGFYRQHYYAKPIFEYNGIKYRLVNDWKEPPNPRNNRTPLENWIRRMGLEFVLTQS